MFPYASYNMNQNLALIPCVDIGGGKCQIPLLQKAHKPSCKHAFLFSFVWILQGSDSTNEICNFNYGVPDWFLDYLMINLIYTNICRLEVALLLIIYIAYGYTRGGSSSFILLTISSWFLVVSWLFAPYIFNPSGFEWQKYVQNIPIFQLISLQLPNIQVISPVIG